RTSVATGQSRCPALRSSPTSTAFRWRHSCPRWAPPAWARPARSCSNSGSPPTTPTPTWPTGPCRPGRSCSAAGTTSVGGARSARAIQPARGDYNGRVLSFRADVLRALAIVYDESPDGLVERLTERGVTVEDPRAVFNTP